MNKLLFGLLLTTLGWVLPMTGVAQATPTSSELWQGVPESAITRSGKARQIVPDRYRSYTLNRGRLQAVLQRAPSEKSRRPQDSGVTLLLPLPTGGFGNFRIVESPVMEPLLAAKYPQVKTYLGQGIDDPSATLRLDVTPKGFHAQVIGVGGTFYIDPFQPGDIDHYITYRKHDHTSGERGICLVTGLPIIDRSSLDGATDRSQFLVSELVSGATLRTYRLAMAATGEYTSFHGGTVPDALAAIVTTVNRVNGVYEREVSVRMVLVANNDQIIYTNAATDPYANTSGDLAANQSNIDSVIGSANYDFGHLVGTGGGGIAGLGVICKAASKAQGLTGSSAPVADGFDIDYVAHEMGHQFAGNHTFNGSGGSCAGGNRNASTAYEPGSGLTIQAYAGICGGDNVQPNSEDYFHRASLNEVIAYTTSGTGGTCGTPTATGNAVPTISTPATFTIPGRTPFTLSASGSDADGDPLTYLWEQLDLGTANSEGVLSATGTTGPLFRSFAPTTNPARTLPSLRYILNNANAVPATAALPGTTTPLWMTGEVLPDASRTLSFRVTVRDNQAGGGGTNEASTTITVNNAAGPFAITSPNTAVSLAAGSAQTVTWNVAGTVDAPISTANVRITLSTDGGFTYPTELLATTPNDGTQGVTLPAGIATTQARIRIEAVDNIYFDVSDSNFTITTGGNSPPAITVTGSVTTRQGAPMASAVVATISDAQDAASALSVAVTGAPPELLVSVQNNSGNVTLSATADCTLVAPTTGSKVYPVLLRVTDSNGAVRTAEVNVNVGSNRVPTLGTYANLSMTQSALRQNVPSALAGDADGNFSGTSISPATLPGGGTIGIAADGTVTVVTGASTPLGTYLIRPQVGDTCGAVETRQFNVVVGSPQVVLAVVSSQVTSGNALIEPNECNQLNVTLRNDGNIPATGVSAVLSTIAPNVSITQAGSSYADIPPGESRTNALSFQVSTTNSLTCFSNVNLTLTASYSGAGSPFAGAVVLPVGRALATNYAFTTSTGATLPNDGVLLPGSQVDDGLTDVVVPAGFNFSIYGTAITGGTTLRASSNGNLQFVDKSGAADANNTALPAAGTGNGPAKFPAGAPTLFMQWDDWRMDGAAGGAALDAGIYTKLEGVAPNRTWIIEWRGRVRGDGAVTTNNNRAAIVLHEGSNVFDYIYLLTGVGAAANAAGATIGIQSAGTGTTFTQYAIDNANLAAGTKLTAAIPPAICAPGTGGCSATPSAPGAPTIGTAVAGNASATVAFTPPASNGGSAITGYTATSSPGSFTSSGCVASPCSVGGMTNGVSYTFTVTATNAIGTSPPSAASNSVIPSPPLPTPSLSIGDVTVVEGDAGTKLATFTISLSGPSSSSVGYEVTTEPGTAMPEVDYVSNTVISQVIEAGQTSGTFSVTINGDTLVEDNETFTANLRMIVGATVADGQAKGTITNNDNAVLSIADATLAEGNSGESTATFIVKLSSPMPTPVTFNVATSNGTASAGSDYVARNQVARLMDAGRTQARFEVAVTGDATAEADETFNVTLSGVVGATLGDAAAVGTIQNDDGAALVPIAQIQGGSVISPLLNRDVETQGIVTALIDQGFVLQTADDAQDGDASTSEGLHVVSGDGAVRIGDALRVHGQVQEARSSDDPNQLTLTQLVARDVAVASRDNALPRAMPLDARNAGADQPIGGLERFEGMRVSVPQLTVVAPEGGRLVRATGEVLGTGRFHGVVQGVARPFREPGLSVLEGAMGKAGMRPLVFDANPERLLVDSLGQRGAIGLSVDSGDSVAGLVGVLGYRDGAYQVSPDPTAAVSVVSGANPRAISKPTTGQMTIGSFDLRRTFDDSKSSGEVVPNTAAHAIRLAKTAEVICAYTHDPAIVGIVGLDARATLDDLAAAVNGNAGNQLFPGSCANDAAYRAVADRGSLGFMVSTAPVRSGVPRVVVLSINPQGAGQTFRHRDGRGEPLHEHAPLLMRARINTATGASEDVTVIAVQLSALDGNLSTPGPQGWATRGDYLRARRNAQALALVGLIQTRQQANPREKLIVLGDFDAPGFSDGHADLIGVLTGREGSLTNLTTRLPASQRYNVTREGNAVALGHILVNQALLSAYPDLHLEMARVNADFGADNAGDAMVPVRAAERDPQVLYLQGP